MADLIDGSTSHTHYAPLSTGQTIAISRHLQDQIRLIETKLVELQKGLLDANEGVIELRDSSVVTNHAVHALQDGLKSTNNMVEANRKELGRANGGAQKFQSVLEQVNTMVAALRDTQKVTNNGLQKLGQDQVETHTLAVKLQESIERRLDLDIAELKSEVGKTNLDLKHLKADEEADKLCIIQERDKLRESNIKMKSIADDLAETNTLLQIFDQRVQESSGSLKATKQNLEDLNLATLKLHEDHENTKVQVAEVRGSVKKVHTHVKQVHDSLAVTNQGLNVCTGRLEECCQVVDSLRGSVGDTQGKLNALKDGQERTNGIVQHVRRELQEVGATTAAVKAGLKEQSSLLLPNLTMDSQEARSASQRHGSLLHTGVGQLSSPRKPGSRNGTRSGLGQTAPAGMAWT